MRRAMLWFLGVAACSSPAPAPVHNAARGAGPGDVVLLFSPPGEHRQFQPLICAVGGTVQSGVACADLVPAETDARLVGGAGTTLKLTRSTARPMAEDFNPASYPAPYAPACCNYKGCAGKTTQYDVAAQVPAGPALAVWPVGASVAFAAGAGTQVQGSKMKAAVIPDVLISTTDLNGDGKKELVIYEPDANDYGISVRLDSVSGPELMSFGCGNG